MPILSSFGVATHLKLKYERRFASGLKVDDALAIAAPADVWNTDQIGPSAHYPTGLSAQKWTQIGASPTEPR